MKNRKFKLTLALGTGANDKLAQDAIAEIKKTLKDFFECENAAFEIEEINEIGELEEQMKKITMPAPRNNATTV